MKLRSHFWIGGVAVAQVYLQAIHKRDEVGRESTDRIGIDPFGSIKRLGADFGICLHKLSPDAYHKAKANE